MPSGSRGAAFVEPSALAERLQIASAFTSFVVVAERSAEEKAKGLPATMAVPHMLPAGFGGAVRAAAVAAFELNLAQPAVAIAQRAVSASAPPSVSDFLRRYVTGDERQAASESADVGVSRIDHALARVLLEQLRQGPKPTTLLDLETAGLDPDLGLMLVMIATEMGVSEEDVVDAFLEMLVLHAEEKRGEFDAVRSGWSLRRALFAGRGTRKLRAALRERVFVDA